jgi:endonuclease/exonuclease/phosphatase family metal-dependent hydrolase
MNAEPGSEELSRLGSAGFVNAQTEVPTSWRDDTLIDHVLVGPGVTVTDVEVPDERTSDHRPVVATVALA